MTHEILSAFYELYLKTFNSIYSLALFPSHPSLNLTLVIALNLCVFLLLGHFVVAKGSWNSVAFFVWSFFLSGIELLFLFIGSLKKKQQTRLHHLFVIFSMGFISSNFYSISKLGLKTPEIIFLALSKHLFFFLLIFTLYKKQTKKVFTRNSRSHLALSLISISFVFSALILYGLPLFNQSLFCQSSYSFLTTFLTTESCLQGDSAVSVYSQLSFGNIFYLICFLCFLKFNFLKFPFFAFLKSILPVVFIHEGTKLVFLLIF